MKIFKLNTVIALIITVLALNVTYAADPTYKLSIQNLKNTSENSLEFDIYLQHTNPDQSEFKYVLGQYFMNFNPEIANGGTLSFSIISSDLPQGSIPGNPSIDKGILRMAVNPLPSMDNLPVISPKAPGTLIAKVKLSTNAKEFANVPLNLNFRLGPDNPFTKVTNYEDGKIKDVTVVATSEMTEDNLQQGGDKTTGVIPTQYALMQNYPNPFNPETKIQFDLPSSSIVKLSVYDITGRELAVLVNEKLEAGSYNYKWNGAQFASGMYFYRVQAGDFVQTRKMVLIK